MGNVHMHETGPPGQEHYIFSCNFLAKTFYKILFIPPFTLWKICDIAIVTKVNRILD